MKFYRTKSIVELIKEQIRLICNVCSIGFQIIFFAYYIYLIVIHLDNLFYLIVYSVLLASTLVLTIIEIVLLSRKADNRLSRQIKKEKRQKYRLTVQFLRYPLKVATVIFAAVDLCLNGGSTLESISLTVGIVAVILTPIYLVIMYTFYRDIDLITLAIKLDVSETKIISKFVGQDEDDLVFTPQEEKLIQEVDELKNVYAEKVAVKEAQRKEKKKEKRKAKRKERLNKIKSGIKNIFHHKKQNEEDEEKEKEISSD